MARALGKTGGLNFPTSDALEINGPRTEGADKGVAGAVEAAKKFVAAGGAVANTSIYVGVSKAKLSPEIPWQARIYVSSNNCRCI